MYDSFANERCSLAMKFDRKTAQTLRWGSSVFFHKQRTAQRKFWTSLWLIHQLALLDEALDCRLNFYNPRLTANEDIDAEKKSQYVPKTPTVQHMIVVDWTEESRTSAAWFCNKITLPSRTRCRMVRATGQGIRSPTRSWPTRRLKLSF